MADQGTSQAKATTKRRRLILPSESMSSTPSHPPPPSSQNPSHSNQAQNEINLQRWLTSPEQRADFVKYFERCTLIVPRFLHDADFEGSNLYFYEVLQELQLLDFCYISGDFYPDLVKVFYCNMRWDPDTTTLTSEVKGKSISINLNRWMELTHLPTDGVIFTGSGPNNLWGAEYDKHAAKQALFLPGTNLHSSTLTSGTMRRADRLLHYVLVRCLLPQPGNYFQVIGDDILLLWAIKNNKPINWGWFILLHMREFATKVRASIDQKKKIKTKSLPYAMLITHILRAFRVSFAGEYKESPIKTMCIDAQFLYSKGWEHIPDLGWRHIGPAEDIYDDDDAVPEPADIDPPAQPDLLPPYMQQFMTHMDTRMDDLTALVTSGFTNLNLEMGLLRNEIREVRDRQHGGGDA